MAKIIKYNLCTRVNHGTEEEPQIEEILSAVTMGWSEANEAIAAKEAHNGEYTVDDDGQEETEQQPTQEQRIAELEAALEMLLSGVTEE